MEGRVTKLEALAADSRERLARIEAKLDTVANEVGQWKWFALGAAVTIVLTVLGTSVAIQQMTVATFQGAAEQQQRSAPAAAQQPIIINVPPASPSQK